MHTASLDSPVYTYSVHIVGDLVAGVLYMMPIARFDKANELGYTMFIVYNVFQSEANLAWVVICVYIVHVYNIIRKCILFCYINLCNSYRKRITQTSMLLLRRQCSLQRRRVN